MAQINTLQGDNVTSLREYLHDEENISYSDFNQIISTASEILKRCLDTNQSGSCQGLIYGYIQSGKTSVILTTMALAADNGYNNFIIMTSDSIDIYEQTLNRIKGALDSFQVFGKRDFQNNLVMTSGLPVALVSSKNWRVLESLSDMIQAVTWRNEPVIIIDDEADQASLDTNINDLNKPQSAINQRILNIRDYLNSYTYLQTTATPQSLLLQDSQSAFRPDFVVVTEPGTGYIGGNYFFGSINWNASSHIRTVSLLDVDRLRTSNHIPNTVKSSILLFFLGAATLRLKGSSKKYTYLLHTSFRQDDHHLAVSLVDQFKTDLINQLRRNSTSPMNGVSSHLKQLLQDAYNDLLQTFSNSPLNIPPLSDVVAETARRITSTEVIEINSSTGDGINPNLARKHALYIGGTKIGRGVTVKNLLVTYYGRNAQQPQMDTVLQHARMYGYRQSELPAIRIYLPTHLADRFHGIHLSDDAVREQCRTTHLPIHVIPLVSRGIRPTRRNVLNENTVNLVTYQGGSQYFPSLPISDPNILKNQTQQLDSLLSTSKYPDLKHPYTVTIDDILEILNFSYGMLGASGAWDDGRIREAVSTLQNQSRYQNRGTLVIVNRDSNLKKSSTRDYNQLGSVLPGNVGNIPFGVDRNYPALLMTRVRGEIDSQGGWHGVSFWIPVVRFPNGNYAFSINET